MASLLKLLECCFVDDESSTFTKHRTETEYSLFSDKEGPTPTEVADQIVSKLFNAKKNDAALQSDLQSTIHAYGWYDNLAAAIISALEKAISLREYMGPAMKAAYLRSVTAVKQVKAWAEEHPEMAGVIVTLVALGVLALMIPWLMGFLGFVEEGIIEGKLMLTYKMKN
jgi:hypothetical protein